MTTWDKDKMREYQRLRRSSHPKLAKSKAVDSVYLSLLLKNPQALERYETTKQLFKYV